jgi:alpha-beta hydrolase superfamily lysophospholipase
MVQQKQAGDRPFIVLLHGLWLNSLCWEHWAARYQSRGFEVVVRGWPGMELDVESLRRNPSGLSNLGLEEVADHYAGVVRELERPAILIGHSFGGVVAQSLLERGVGTVGVALNPATVKGTLPSSSVRVGLPVLKNLGSRDRVVTLTFDEFRHSFANTFSELEARLAYQRYVVPGPGRVLWEAALQNFRPHAVTSLAVRPRRAPLLLVAGGADHVAPSAATRVNARLQRTSAGITGFQEFPGRSHFSIGQTGWEEMADFALDWALDPYELGDRGLASRVIQLSGA